MKNTMNFTSFIDNWPESRKDNFSYKGFKTLFDYLTEFEESTGEELEFDPVAFDCEFSEYANIEELANDYSNYFDPELNEEDNLHNLMQHTQVINITGTDGYIINTQF